jgi:hypothetical protein
MIRKLGSTVITEDRTTHEVSEWTSLDGSSNGTASFNFHLNLLHTISIIRSRDRAILSDSCIGEEIKSNAASSRFAKPSTCTAGVEGIARGVDVSTESLLRI